MGEASRTGPSNPGTLCFPDSKRQKKGPVFHLIVRFRPDGEVGRLRRSAITPKYSTDRIRYRWQATASGKVQCASQDLITPASALQSWLRKHHQLLTDESMEEHSREVSERILREPSLLRGGTPQPNTLRANYAEGGSAISSGTTIAHRNALRLFQGSIP